MKKIIFIYLFISVVFTNHAQPTLPVIETSTKFREQGFYIFTPYKASLRNQKKSITGYQSIINTNGEVVFFRIANTGSDLKFHSNGKMSYWGGGKYFILDSSFTILDSVKCVNNIETDSHDFKILPNGNYLLIGKETEKQDLSSKKIFKNDKIMGSKQAVIKYDVIQELDKNKNLVYQLNLKPFFNLDDMNHFYLTDTATIDVTHVNSVDLNNKDELLISCRYYDEVLKIRKQDKKIIWRMGGKYNNIKLTNDSIPFLGQHHARYTGKNTITLFDNGYTYDSLLTAARGIEYEINDKDKTAQVIWSYTNKNRVHSKSGGSFHKASPNHFIINYCLLMPDEKNITCELINKNKEVMQTIFYNDTLISYRTYYLKKLPIKLNQPKLKITKHGSEYILKPEIQYKFYIWQDGSTNQEFKTNQIDRIFVYVSNDGINFTRSKTISIQ